MTTLNDLEKIQIECSTSVDGRLTQLEKSDTKICDILEKQYNKINALPWKFFGIVAATITPLLTAAFFIFSASMSSIQGRYEDFTQKIVALEIRNLQTEIENLHSSTPNEEKTDTVIAAKKPLKVCQK